MAPGTGLGAMRSSGYASRRRGYGSPGGAPVVALVVVVALVAAGGYVKHRRDVEAQRRQAQAQTAVTAFLAAMSSGDAGAAGAHVVPARAAAAARLLTAARTQLHAVTLQYAVTGRVDSTGRPGAAYRASLEVRGLGAASWTGRVPLQRVGDTWKVAFTPAVIHPALTEGGRFAYTRERPTRGRVLVADGQSMTVDADLSGNLRGAVTTATTDAEAAAAGPRFLKGDDIGTSGLQRAFNETLQGRPGGSLSVVDAAGRTTATVVEAVRADGKDVRTTLDLRIQRAGEAAMATVPQAGALVAVDTRTGHILALVNKPSAGFGRAIGAKGPPGSTFKIVTSAAALIAGIPPSTVLDCSLTTKVNGRTFKNAENESAGPIGWTEAFAKSCNTWFVRLQDKVPQQTLTSTAALFGFATDADSAKAQAAAAGILPIRSFGGSYPVPRDRSQAAGQSIGQDLVLASPLQMASVAAAVADGTWRQPVLTDKPGTSRPLPAGVATALRGFMAAVPAPGGTAAGAGLPPGTYGKTGTAETAASDADSDKTDSWFVGYRGNIAFAVEFDQAGFGAEVAAPAAARFLRALG
jgi:hypothetical protein